MLVHVAYLLGLIFAITGLLLVGSALGIERCRCMFRAWDYLGAAMLGGDGRHSISAYCGAGKAVAHAVGRWLIDGIFGKGHCEEAARKEGLV